MDMEKMIIRNALSKCRSQNIEALIKRWGCIPDKDLQEVNFRATKNVISHQIFHLCQELGLRHEIGDLDLLCTQMHSIKKTWTVMKLKGSHMKTSLDPQELQDRLTTALDAECVGDTYMNVNSYGGATWIRLYIQGAAPFRVTDVIYVVWFPHTPVLIASRMKVKMQEILYSAMQDVFETEKITEMQLTGHHLSSLADLALQQMAQGPFRKYRDLEEAENPLIRSQSSKTKGDGKEKALNPRLRDENRHDKSLRQERLDSTFGTHTQPTLEKIEYKLDLRFRGTTYAPGMKGHSDLFCCRARFEGTSALEGIKNLGKSGRATLPLPKHIARVHSLAKNHFTITELQSNRKPTSQSGQDE